MRGSLPLFLLIGLLVLPPADAADDVHPGLLLRIYEIGQSVSAVPDIAPGQHPNVLRAEPTVDLGRPGRLFGPIRDHFVTHLDGHLNIARPGTYTLRLLSDDGARFWLDGNLVIDHDGLHAAEPKDATVELAAGQHTLRLRHLEAAGDQRLALYWRPPNVGDDAEFTLIPADAFTHVPPTDRRTQPGVKRIIPPLRRGRPGDGTPVDGLHPAFEFTPTRDFVWVEQSDACANLHFLTTPPSTPTQRSIWMPPNVPAKSDTSCVELHTKPYDGQLLVVPAASGGIWRVSLQSVDDTLQGCVFRHSSTLDGLTVRIGRGREGLLVNGQDSASGVSQVLRIVPSGEDIFEMHSVRAMRNGFEIVFTQPLDSRVGWDPASYLVEFWNYNLEKGIGPLRTGDRAVVESASVADDRRRVFLELANMPTSSLAYIRLLPPCVSEAGARPWSTEAWYTLHAVPRDDVGTVLEPPTTPPQNRLTVAERAAGWKLLFDGQTTKGWRGYGRRDFPRQHWKVIDDCLVRTGPGGDIVTADEFGDFELSLEWRISAGGNSGIFYRVDESKGAPWATGQEMQVLDNAEHADGRNPKTSAGANYALYAPERDVTRPVGLFNEARIVARGQHVEHWLNGVKIAAFEIGSADWNERVAHSKFADLPHFGRVERGHIVLQDHGDRVGYRNIKIRPLVD